MDEPTTTTERQYWRAAILASGATNAERGRVLGMHGVSVERWLSEDELPGPVQLIKRNPVLALALAMEAEDQLRASGINPNLIRERIAAAARLAALDAALEQEGAAHVD